MRYLRTFSIIPLNGSCGREIIFLVNLIGCFIAWATEYREVSRIRDGFPSLASRNLGQHNTTQHNTITQHNTTQQYNTTQHNTTQQHNTTPHHTTQQHNTTQHSTTQHNTTPHHTTTQHNTTQHNTETSYSEVTLYVRIVCEKN